MAIDLYWNKELRMWLSYQADDTTLTKEAAAPVKALNTWTRLAIERTRLSYERTMIAWIRTATALIAFGFTIYKLFQSVSGVLPREDSLFDARSFGLMMIGIGLVSLSIGTLQTRLNLGALRLQDPNIPRSIPTMIAAMVAILGTIAFAALALHK